MLDRKLPLSRFLPISSSSRPRASIGRFPGPRPQSVTPTPLLPRFSTSGSLLLRVSWPNSSGLPRLPFPCQLARHRPLQVSQPRHRATPFPALSVRQPEQQLLPSHLPSRHIISPDPASSLLVGLAYPLVSHLLNLRQAVKGARWRQADRRVSSRRGRMSRNLRMCGGCGSSWSMGWR
jgi:hypothetical protein